MTPQNGFSGTVTVNLSGLPAGVTASPSFPLTVPAGQTTITLTANGSVSSGSYTLQFQASSGTLTSNASLSLTVEPESPASFSFALNFSSLVVSQGGSTGGTFNLSTGSGSTNFSVNLSVTGLPSGVTASFAQNPLPATVNQSSVTLTASSTAALGQNITVQLVGTRASDGATTSANFDLTVAPPGSPPSFVSGACQEETNGGSNNFGITANAGDTIIVKSSDYIGNATITNATWSSGTVTLTVISSSQTSGRIIVSGVNPSGYNGEFTLTGATTGSNATMTYSLASNPGAYVSGGSASGNVQSITDNSIGGPNTYSEIPGSAIAENGGMITQWAAANVKAGSYTVSVNYAPGDLFNTSCVDVFTNMPPALQVDQVTVGITNASSFIIKGLSIIMTTPSINGNFTHEVLLVATGTQNAVWLDLGLGITPPCGSTPPLTQDPGNNGLGGAPAAYLADTGSGTGSFCASFTLDTAELNDLMSLVTLKSNSSQ